jgi:hypothetical protein
MEDFMKVTWPSKDVAVAELFLSKYPEGGLVIENFIPIIDKFLRLADALYIKADLTNVGAVPLPVIPSLVKLIQDIIKYTDNDNIVVEIEYINAGFIFKMLYKFVIPRKFHSLVKFSTK